MNLERVYRVLEKRPSTIVTEVGDDVHSLA
jgi:hypothetical protein